MTKIAVAFQAVCGISVCLFLCGPTVQLNLFYTLWPHVCLLPLFLVLHERLSDRQRSVGLVSISSTKLFLPFVRGQDSRWSVPVPTHCRPTMERCLPDDKLSIYRPVLIVLHIVCENNLLSEWTCLRVMILLSTDNALRLRQSFLGLESFESSN